MCLTNGFKIKDVCGGTLEPGVGGRAAVSYLYSINTPNCTIVSCSTLLLVAVSLLLRSLWSTGPTTYLSWLF